MKWVNGLLFCIMLLFAAYGAFMFVSHPQPPKEHIDEEMIAELRSKGINVGTGEGENGVEQLFGGMDYGTASQSPAKEMPSHLRPSVGSPDVPPFLANPASLYTQNTTEIHSETPQQEAPVPAIEEIPQRTQELPDPTVNMDSPFSASVFPANDALPEETAFSWTDTQNSEPSLAIDEPHESEKAIQFLPPVEEQDSAFQQESIAPKIINSESVVSAEFDSGWESTSSVNPVNWQDHSSTKTDTILTPFAPTIVPGTEQEPVRQQVQQLANEYRDTMQSGNIRDGYTKLSGLYIRQDLYLREQRMLLPLLDQLASDVLYGADSFAIDPPYCVKQGDSIESIAAVHKISPELLARLNGLKLQQPLLSGQNLKVVSGPFNAAVFQSKCEILMTVNGLYAGRFCIGVSKNIPANESEYRIQGKNTRWIPLSGNLGFYETADPSLLGTDLAQREGFCLSSKDMRDLCILLTSESSISVRR